VGVLIGIYMRPDRTQVIKGEIKKNKSLDVILTRNLSAYTDALEHEDVDQLTEMFLEIKEMTSTFAEEIYLVLSDYQFVSVDCYLASNTADEEIERRQIKEVFRERLRIEKMDDVYYTIPMLCKSAFETRRTIYTISRRKIDALIEAAKATDVALVSVEPASYSYLRSLHQWEEEHCLVEIFDHNACIVSYSPVAGIFRHDCIEINGRSFEADPVAVNEKVNVVLMQNDMTAKETFELINNERPLRILSDKKEIRMVPAWGSRLQKPDSFPGGVNSDLIDEEQAEWMVPLGSILQAYESKPVSLYDPKPECLTLTDANLLPADVRKNSRFQRFRKIAKKYTKILVVVLALLTGIEVFGVLYFSTVSIPDTLQSEYDRAHKEFDPLKKELELINAARTEDQSPLEALDGILSQRPQNLGFAEIEIGEKGNVKEADRKWIRFTAKTEDPLLIRDYTSLLSQDSRFAVVNVEQISSDSSTNLKAATVVIKKGKVE
jgi:hypothetical protein